MTTATSGGREADRYPRKSAAWSATHCAKVRDGSPVISATAGDTSAGWAAASA